MACTRATETCTRFRGTLGLPLGENGFLNLTAEYGNAEPTDRSVQRNDAITLINSGNAAVRNPAQIWGSPKVSDDLKLWANTDGVPLTVEGGGSGESPC